MTGKEPTLDELRTALDLNERHLVLMIEEKSKVRKRGKSHIVCHYSLMGQARHRIERLKNEIKQEESRTASKTLCRR